MNEPIKLVTVGYIPIPERELLIAEEIIAAARTGAVTGFVIVGVGPEHAGWHTGFSGGRMDRMQLLGNLAMLRRMIEEAEVNSR